MSSPISLVTREVLVNILSKVDDIESVLQLASVCHEWYTILRDSYYWFLRWKDRKSIMNQDRTYFLRHSYLDGNDLMYTSNIIVKRHKHKPTKPRAVTCSSQRRMWYRMTEFFGLYCATVPLKDANGPYVQLRTTDKKFAKWSSSSEYSVYYDRKKGYVRDRCTPDWYLSEIEKTAEIQYGIVVAWSPERLASFEKAPPKHERKILGKESVELCPNGYEFARNQIQDIKKKFKSQLHAELNATKA